MNNSTTDNNGTIGSLVESLPEYKLLMVERKYGRGSREFKEAEYSYMKEVAELEAEYRMIKAANQARLYEEGY